MQKEHTKGSRRFVLCLFFAGSAGQVAGACPDPARNGSGRSGNASRAKSRNGILPNPGTEYFVARASPSSASVQDHAPIASNHFYDKARPPKSDAVACNLHSPTFCDLDSRTYLML